jgi:acid phosphatase type 7
MPRLLAVVILMCVVLNFVGQQPIGQPKLARGPYLQSATSESMVIRWQTKSSAPSVVHVGTHWDSLQPKFLDSILRSDHEVRITDLKPSTRYYYGIGTSQNELLSSGPNHFFETMPTEGTPGLYRFWVVGDAGTGTDDQRAVRDGYLTYMKGAHANGWIMLGDNAYQSGFDREYQTGVFENMYEDILENTVLWPAPGNHDYNNHLPFSPKPAYYDIFTLPAQGEAGGVPSGTEKYYSWNFGHIHFISLDSYDENRRASGAMVKWLVQDLEANTLPWVIAYWHHPPYTKGSHNSDNPWLIVDPELPKMRKHIVPVLERYGVDLVLSGHSHSYERSFLLDGHYGKSRTLTNEMILDNGSGSYPSAPAYSKPAEKQGRAGAVYTVVGCSGKLSRVSKSWPHPVMHTASNEQLGSLVIEVEGNRLYAYFITTKGEVFDHFSIEKR